MKMGLTTVFPSTAEVMLRGAMPGTKRHHDVIRTLAQTLRDQCWVINGMPIVISQSGQLLDGQQRLAACVEAQVPLRTFVVEGVHDDALLTLDQHRRRTFGGMLKYQGFAHHHLLAALMLRLERYEEHDLAGVLAVPTCWVRLDRALHASTAPAEAVATSLAHSASPLPEAVRTLIIYMGYRVDRTATDRLLDAVEHPERYGRDEPGALLHEEIARERENGIPAAGTTRLTALAIKALNATRRNEGLRRLAWADRPAGRHSPEPFPLLDGYPGLFPDGIPAGEDVPDSEITCTMERIDAAAAQRYLATGPATRQTIAAHVQALATDIKLGRWISNAQPICFARDGRLINGQHRLLAVIAAKGTIEAPVVRGLPSEAYVTYDAQQKRASAVDQPAPGFGDQALATAMANLLWRHERRTDAVRYKRASATEIREILTQHPRLIELRGFARRMVSFGRSSVMGYGAYVIEREDPKLGNIFLEALVTGADLPAGHPILLLRNGLQRLRRENASQAEQLAALLNGWRRYRLHPAAEQDGRRQAGRRGN
jgi:hypothetical protein